MPKSLSKSRYTAFCQCPKNLWLKVYKPEEAKEDPALQAHFEQGNEVGDLAMGLFGPYKEVTVKNSDGSLDLTAMCELTPQYMSQGVDNICEASFALDGHYCAVDILRRNGDGWDIYEVKSSSFSQANDKLTDLEKYAPDIAYQKWVLTQCDVKVIKTYLVCLNSDYVRYGELDIKSLFVTIDMHDLVENEYLKVPAQSSQALKIVNDGNEPDIDLSERCNKPYRCAFWDYCKQQHGVPSPSIFEVYGGTMKSTKEDRFFMPQKLEPSMPGCIFQILPIGAARLVTKEIMPNRKIIATMAMMLLLPFFDIVLCVFIFVNDYCLAMRFRPQI